MSKRRRHKKTNLPAQRPGPDTRAQPPAPDKHKAILQHASFSGPLPPPSILAQYEAISPGFADRIVALAEGEAQHRRARENRELDIDAKIAETQLREVQLGQVFAFLIGMTAILSGAYAATSGAEIAGGLIGAGGVIGLVTAFIQGRKRAT